MGLTIVLLIIGGIGSLLEEVNSQRPKKKTSVIDHPRSIARF